MRKQQALKNITLNCISSVDMK